MGIGSLGLSFSNSERVDWCKHGKCKTSNYDNITLQLRVASCQWRGVSFHFKKINLKVSCYFLRVAVLKE